MAKMKISEECRVTTPKCVLSYPHLFVPHSFQKGAQEKFSAELILPEGSDLSELKAAMKQAANDKWGAAMPKGLQSAIKSGDEHREGKPGYEGKKFISPWSMSKPGIVKGRKADEVVTNPTELYAGCIVIASVTAFGWESGRDCGVSFFLNNIWKIRDGKEMAPRSNPSGDFQGLDLDEDAFGSDDSDDDLFGGADDDLPF